MKIITILVVALSLSFLTGCSKFPKYPDQLKVFHQVMVKGERISQETLEATVNAEELASTWSQNESSVKCLRFDVVQVNPYQFHYAGAVPLTDCHEVAGYKPAENVLLWNWIDDVFRKLQKQQQPTQQETNP